MCTLIKVQRSDFMKVIAALGHAIIINVGRDTVTIETNRLERRELTRYGISYTYPRES